MWILVSLVIVGVFLSTAILQWLWNETMPELFRVPTVSFWQAFRLLLIATILIGGPGFVNFNLGL
jgi:hypothetical protein